MKNTVVLTLKVVEVSVFPVQHVLLKTKNQQSVRLLCSSVVQVITSGRWNYTLTMRTYTDAGLTQAVDQSTDVLVNQQIWVQLDAEGLDGNQLALVTDSCWATDQPSATASLRYDLIKDR